jgi:hypothetical protein
MKKGPLSKKEKTLIENSYLDIAIAELASKMDRSENMINKYLATLDTSEQPEPETKVKNVGDLYAKKKEYGVTIMTETASVVSDENKSNKSKMPPRYHKHIHRIKDE